jgi:GTP-binding protein Era
MNQTYCGTIGIIGRPNVGKSTLLNRILGMKVSITSSKPQTTQQQILGIHTQDNKQYIFMDTPGLHQSQQKYSNRLMNRAAKAAVQEAGILLWVVDSTALNQDDEAIVEKLAQQSQPILVALNKKDEVDEARLFELTAQLSVQLPEAQFVACSAKNGFHIEYLLEILGKLLPQGPFLFEEDVVTNASEKFYASEIIREKIMRHTGQEIPYSCTIEIDQYEMKNNVLHIFATIWIDKESQKAIIVGSGGEKLKTIGTEARFDLEKFWQQKIFLKLWVKVKKTGFIPPNYL